MTARILVVDDTPANSKLLDVRLTAEYYEVLTARSGLEALLLCAERPVDLVLLDVMMPGLDGFETCRRFKSDPVLQHIPIVMVTALDQPADRVRGLEAGADDFLTKPVDETALFARVRSLTRLKQVVDELRQRADATASLGIADHTTATNGETGLGGRILVVDDRPSSLERIARSLSGLHTLDSEPDPQAAMARAAEGGYDLAIISLGLQQFDALRLCSQLRSHERTRILPILMIADLEDGPRVLRGLDMGAIDYLLRPVDRNELLPRVRTQIKRKRYSDNLRMLLQTSIQMAVVDPLTGLNNRRYLENHLKSLLMTAASRGNPLSLMILDIDHFKSVNDTYGHDSGDEVLRAFAERVKKTIRTGDILCRLGGEEFIVVLPETNIELAELIAERVRFAVAQRAFPIERGARAITVTVSIGIADRGADVEPGAVFKRADVALYRSKDDGRNRVTAQAA